VSDRSSGPAGEATLALASELIACRSLTPDDGGSLAIIARRLTTAGFVCKAIDRGGVRNLWATHGTGRPLVCLAGHVDVVPPGPLESWTSDPFVPVVRDGCLFGRGAADMKASVAAMVTAAERLAAADPVHPGTVALLLTADEEGEARDGTAAVVDVLRARGVAIDACLLGEPTSTRRFGDTIKNGRRGSLNGVLRIHGVQCHVAYPERGRNPINTGLAALAELAATVWDGGTPYFPPTSFQISNVHAGAGANNVIPGAMDVVFNFRFSPASPAETLKARVHEVIARHQLSHDLAWTLSGEPFITGEGPLLSALAAAISDEVGVTPELSTSGGTSDGRFLATLAGEVVEFGPSNATIHRVDEHVAVAELAPLTIIYERTVARRLSL
jgi:succinyl-diaminopimelate desuccinylase